jgi:anti-sigma factor RsiW
MEHPAEEKLVLLLASELAAEDERALKLHLARCAACREKIAEFEAGFRAFSNYLRNTCVPLAGQPPNSWKAFPELLERVNVARSHS